MGFINTPGSACQESNRTSKNSCYIQKLMNLKSFDPKLTWSSYIFRLVMKRPKIVSLNVWKVLLFLISIGLQRNKVISVKTCVGYLKIYKCKIWLRIEFNFVCPMHIKLYSIVWNMSIPDLLHTLVYKLLPK